MKKIKEFYAKVLQDEESRAELKEILKGKSVEESDESQLLEIGKLAQKFGYEITLEEVKSYLSGEDMELGEEDLDAVAGGKSTEYVDIYVCNVGGQAGVDDNNFGPNAEFKYHKYRS